MCHLRIQFVQVLFLRRKFSVFVVFLSKYSHFSMRNNRSVFKCFVSSE